MLLGTLTPRVEVRPDDIVGSEAEFAIDLMEAAGKPLEQWQRDGVDLMMSTRPDGKWACYEYAEWVARQQGKGVIGETRVLYGFLVLEEEITWSAHQYRTTLIAYRRIRDLLRSLGTVHQTSREEVIEIDDVPVKVWNSNDQRGFERMDLGRRVGFFARSKGGQRGASPDLNIIDEAFAYEFEQQDAIMPTLIAKPNAQTIYLSSPPLTGDTGEVMFALKERAEGGQARRLGYRDFGLAGHLEDIERVDIDDRRLWRKTCPGLGRGRVTEETILAMRDSMSRPGFGREVFGMWPRKVVALSSINMANWANLKVDGAKREGDVTLAVDITPQRDYAAIGMFAKTAEGKPFVRLLRDGPGVDWLVAAIVAMKAELDPIGIAVGHGTGASIETELAKVGIKVPDKELGPRRGDLYIMNSTDMSAACGQFIDAVNQGSFLWVPDSEGVLNGAAAGAAIKQLSDSIAWSRKDAAANITPLVTVTEARWLYGEWAHLIDQEVEPWVAFV